MGRGGNTRKNSVGSKDQDTVDGAIKEGCEEMKMQGIQNAQLIQSVGSSADRKEM